jgi:hypothetical protein
MLLRQPQPGECSRTFLLGLPIAIGSEGPRELGMHSCPAQSHTGYCRRWRIFVLSKVLSTLWPGERERVSTRLHICFAGLRLTKAMHMSVAAPGNETSEPINLQIQHLFSLVNFNFKSKIQQVLS